LAMTRSSYHQRHHRLASSNAQHSPPSQILNPALNAWKGRRRYKTHPTTQPFRRRPRPIFLFPPRHNGCDLRGDIPKAFIAVHYIDDAAMAI
jgi:hypothetical protein